LALKSYTKLHQSITSGVNPSRKYVRIECGGFCGGWGDRLKGMLNAIALGLLLDRAFIVDLMQAGLPLSEIYQPSPVKWNARLFGSKKLSIRCIDGHCGCLIDALKLTTEPNFLDQYDGIELISNQDCSGALMNINMFAEKRKQLGIDSNPAWRGQLMDEYFKPTPALETLMHKFFINGKWPEYAIHVRTGLIPGDPQRFTGRLDAWINSYVSCLEMLKPNVTDAPVFIAVDNQQALDQLVSKVTFNHWKALTATGIGQLGHVERYQAGGNLALRMHAEFEVLRRVDTCLQDRQGSP